MVRSKVLLNFILHKLCDFFYTFVLKMAAVLNDGKNATNRKKSPSQYCSPFSYLKAIFQAANAYKRESTEKL